MHRSSILPCPCVCLFEMLFPETARNSQTLHQMLSNLWYSLLIFWGRLSYSSFIYIMMSNFKWDHLYCKKFSILGWSPNLKFQIWVRSNLRLLRYSCFNILRLSSFTAVKYTNWGHPFVCVWSPKVKFQFLERSDQWLLG